jgi:formiminotetrahydrofolate cyclodeaminase
MAQTVDAFVAALAAKQPTPGGGAAAAAMSAQYTQRKKDLESGAATAAQELIAKLDLRALLEFSDRDAAAYADLQRSWKSKDITDDEKAKIEAAALEVPMSLVTVCHAHIMAIKTFLPSCNSNITSDAKVGIHQLAGSARAAYQTALVNSPPSEERERLRVLLQEIRDVEDELLEQ